MFRLTYAQQIDTSEDEIKPALWDSYVCGGGVVKMAAIQARTVQNEGRDNCPKCGAHVRLHTARLTSNVTRWSALYLSVDSRF